MISKKISQFIEVQELDTTAYIPLIQGSPLYNAVITPENLSNELSPFLDNLYIKVDGTNSNLDILKFNTNQPEQALLAGEMAYSQLEGTIELGMNGGEVKQSLGLELYIRYKPSENILNGELLMYDGTDGNSGTVKLKKATVNCDPKLIYAIATEDATTGGLHFATWYGKIKDINTSMYQTGSDLYQSTTTAGALQSTQPAAPYNKASYAKVINAHSTQGTLFVRINRSVSMNDINDVDTTNSQTNQPLVKQSDGVWKGSDTIQVDEIIPRTDSVKISDLEASNASIAELHSLNIKADNYVESAHFTIPFKGDNEIITAGGGTKEISDFQLKSEKGQPNGYASLDAAGLIPTTQLPAYVDDVLEFANLAAFPTTGETGKIYVAKDTNKTYRWSGSVYIYITSGAVDSVAGKTGVVTLVKGDVGLGNVDNTSDLNKPISTATQIALSGKVNNTGNETIAGVKTFSSLPKVPLTPLANEDAASKAYADGQANAALTLAQKYAENPEDVEVVTGEYSAKHYSLKAAASAAGIADSAEMLVKHEAEIASIENTLNSANINQEAQTTVSGVDTIALPKTAANTGMQVQLFGQSATQLVTNGNFANGTTGWSGDGSTRTVVNGVLTVTGTGASVTPNAYTSIGNKIVGNKYYLRANVTPKSSLCASLRLTSIDSVQIISNPVINNSYLLSGIITASSTYNLIVIYHYYASTADVTGAAIEVDNVMAINLTATYGAGNEPTKEQCDILFANYFEGSDNVMGTGRVRSVGKNLFNGILEQGSILVDGTLSSSGTAVRTTNFISVEPSKQYTITTTFNNSSNFIRVIAYDINRAFISVILSETSAPNNTGVSFTTPANTKYIKFRYYNATALTISNVLTVQIERNSTATTYEPYRESILQLTTPELRSNSLIKDEIRKGTNGYELVKRVGVGTLGAEMIANAADREFSSDTGFWGKSTGVTISDGTANFNGTANSELYKSNYLIIGKYYKAQFEIKNFSSGSVQVRLGYNGGGYKNANGVYQFIGICTSIQQFDFKANTIGFVGSIDNVSVKEVTASEAISATSTFTELGSNVHFTLATPTISPIAHAGLLNSNSNGTAYFEPIIADAGVYASNIAVQLTDYPIASFESIRKYANGTYTELNTATAVIAANGLSFTHPNLAVGDLVMFTYAYNKESIGRSMTFTYPISNSNPYYNVTNSVPLTSGYYTSTTARAAVPEGVRKTGLILTYETAAGVWYTERYIGTATDTTSFTNAANWEVGVLRIASVTDTTEYAEITI